MRPALIPIGKLHLRPATWEDRARCWQLTRQTMREYVASAWGWDEADQRRRFEAAFEPGLRWIIEHAGRAIGMLQVDFDATPVRLLNLQVAPSHQRRGLGSAVIGDVVRRAGARGVWLQVLKVNPAKALYARLGFGVIAETATHWQMLHATSAGVVDDGAP